MNKPSGHSARFFKSKFTFTIIHNEKILEFSIGHGTTKSADWFRIQIVNGGERVGRPTRLRGRNFHVFTGVELDKKARTDSSEDRKVYRQVKDRLCKNLTREKG